MPNWVLIVAGGILFALLYAVMAAVFADVGVANIIVVSILAAGVGAIVTAVFVASRTRGRRPRL
jgi:hypothetical protein